MARDNFKRGYAAALAEQEKRGKRVLARAPHFRLLPAFVLEKLPGSVVDRSAQRVVEGSVGTEERPHDFY